MRVIKILRSVCCILACMHVDLKYYYFCISIISWSVEIQNKGQFLCIKLDRLNAVKSLYR